MRQIDRNTEIHKDKKKERHTATEGQKRKKDKKFD